MYTRNTGILSPAMILTFSLAFLGGCAGSQQQDQEPAAPEPVTATPQQPDQPCVCPQSAPAETAMPVKELPTTRLQVVGAVEYVIIGDNLMQQKARIDTGATTTSVGISSLEVFERDGKSWVRFSVTDRVVENTVDFERPLVRRVQIKRHNAAPDERPVVTLPLRLGDIKRTIEVTLNNRDSFDYPVLIGRNFLDGFAVVDVSGKYIALNKDQP